MVNPRIDQQVTFLYTCDLEATTRFYENILGLNLALDQGACRIYRVSPSGFIGICQRDQDPPPRDHVIFTIVTRDVDQWFEALRQRGVEFEKKPAINPEYNIYHCFLRDPNGYLIEIQRFLDPAWPSRAE